MEKPARAGTVRRIEKVQGLCRIVYDSHGYHEGIRAFKEKRKPVFTGKQAPGAIRISRRE